MRRLLPIVILLLGCSDLFATPAATAGEKREFSFFLARFEYLFLARSPEGYRLTFVSDSKNSEQGRVRFDGFHVVSSSGAALYLKHASKKTGIVEIYLMKLPTEYGQGNNRALNTGHWRMDISGSGEQLRRISKELLTRRVSEFWDAQELQVHGETIQEHQFKPDYVRR